MHSKLEVPGCYVVGATSSEQAPTPPPAPEPVCLSAWLSIPLSPQSGCQDQAILDAPTLQSCSPASFAFSPHLMTLRWLLYIRVSHMPARRREKKSKRCIPSFQTVPPSNFCLHFNKNLTPCYKGIWRVLFGHAAARDEMFIKKRERMSLQWAASLPATNKLLFK